jgi:1,2-diacylglycerol 3-alpha-glucosyltransferase
MRILITSDWYKPVINGVVTSVLNLRAGLTAAGHEVRILTLSDSLHSRREGDVYYVASLNAGMVYPNARLKLNMPRHMLQEILDWSPDIIHSQCEFSTFRIAKEIASICKIPLIHTYHTVYEDFTHYFCPSRTVGKKMAEVLSRNILSGTDAVIVPSAKIEDMLHRYRVQKSVHVIPSGIDLEEYLTEKSEKRLEIRARFGITPEECILIYLGRLAKEKNLSEVLQLLKDCEDSQRLLIVGDGPYRAELEQEAQALGISHRLIFTGMVTPQEAPDYYAAGDIFVSASNSETQGLTYMEAMASGLPLLCRADDCLNDVISDGKNGLIYHTPQEFAEKLAKLRNDAAFRQQLGNMAQNTMIEKYSIEAFAAACLRVYSTSIRQMRKAG